MSMKWIIVAATGLCLGVGAATIVTLPLSVAFFVVLIAIAVVLWQSRFKSSHSITLRLAVMLLLFVGIGIARVDYASSQFGHSPLASLVGTTVTLEGVVAREPEERPRNTHLYIETEETLLLVTVDRFKAIAYGDTVIVEGILKLPETFTTDLGRTFDYPGFLRAKGVEYVMSFASVSVVTKDEKTSFLATLFLLKEKFVTRLESVITEPYAALANGLLLGMKEGLGKDLERDFQKAGLTHIVVLSGYNVMLIVSFVTFLLAFLLPARVRLVVGVIAIVSFALTVGLSATVVRASIMATLFLFAQTFGRSYDVLRSLFLAGMVMILINPYLLVYDVGFQLSFMATLGLILALPYFKAPGQPETIGLSVKGYVVSTVATQIAVLPLLLYHIGEISIVSVVVNVLTLPMVPVAMFLSFLTVLATLILAPLATILGVLSTLSLGYIIVVASTFANLPLATVAVPAFSPLFVFLGYAALGLLYYHFTRHKHTPSLHGWTIVEEKEIPTRP